MERHPSLVSRVSSEDLQKTVVLNARSLMQPDPAVDQFTARIPLTTSTRIARLGHLEGRRGQGRQSKAFKIYTARGIEIERLVPG